MSLPHNIKPIVDTGAPPAYVTHSAKSPTSPEKKKGLWSKVKDVLTDEPDPDAYKGTEYEGKTAADITNEADVQAAMPQMVAAFGPNSEQVRQLSESEPHPEGYMSK